MVKLGRCIAGEHSECPEVLPNPDMNSTRPETVCECSCHKEMEMTP